MIIFEESTVNVGAIATATLFYHCDVTLTGVAATNYGRFMSCKLDVALEAFLRNDGLYYYYSQINISDEPDYEFEDILVPVDYLVRNTHKTKAKKVMLDGETFDTEPEHSGNACAWDDRYEYMQDYFLPYSSMNGQEWSLGFDMSEDQSFDFLFIHHSTPDRRLRDSYTFGKGNHVGKYSPTSTTLSLEENNNLASYVLGLVPDELFIPLEVVKIMGIMDGYLNGGIKALWDRNDREIRSFIRSMAVTLGRTSGNIVMMKTAINHLWKNKNNFNCESYHLELNKSQTFRVGKSWFKLTPGAGVTNIIPDPTSGINETPFFWVDDEQRFKIGRVYVSAPTTIPFGRTTVVYLDLADNQEDFNKVGYFSFAAISNLVTSSFTKTYNTRLPLFTFKTDAAGTVLGVMFYRNALIGSSITSVNKYNAVVRSYATKSRSANLFTNLSQVKQYDDLSPIIHDIFNKAFAPDTRIFTWHEDNATDVPTVEELH